MTATRVVTSVTLFSPAAPRESRLNWFLLNVRLLLAYACNVSASTPRLLLNARFLSSRRLLLHNSLRSLTFDRGDLVMSFNARLDPYRRPPSGKPRYAPGPPPQRPQEDAQPNELLQKRRTGGAPPQLVPSAPRSHRPWRGRNKALPAHGAPVSRPAPSGSTTSFTHIDRIPHPQSHRQPRSVDGVLEMAEVRRGERDVVTLPPNLPSGGRQDKGYKASARGSAHPLPSFDPPKVLKVPAPFVPRVPPAGPRIPHPDRSSLTPTEGTTTSAFGLLLNDPGFSPATHKPRTTPTQPPNHATSIPPSSLMPPVDVASTSASSQRLQVKRESASPKIKRERSLSPVLGNARLVTEGSLRIAPLPPECRKTLPGYQAARQQLSNREVQRLKALKLKPVRVFTREDGMVIDWYVAIRADGGCM